MGCFVSCFESRDRDRKVQSRTRARSNSDSYYDLESLEERLVLENQSLNTGSLFLNGEKDSEENLGHPHTLEEELRLEAKHLKLCGAILETPVEIRKPIKRIAFRELNGSDQSPKSAHISSNKKIQLYAQCEQENSPDHAITGTPYGSDQSPKSAHISSNKKIQLYAQCEQENSPDHAITGTPYGSDQSPKSAHISSNKKIQLYAQCEQENSPDHAITGTPGPGKEDSISRQNTPGMGSAEETGGDKLNLTPVRFGMGIRASDPNSPYPTPITLNDDMHTPATIYSSYQETSATGKRARIWAQYVYPVLKPAHRVEISSGIKSVELENENEVAGEFSFHTKKSSEETPKVLVSGLSEWLKPTTALRGRNGIPNSTTKYMEDQQIKWHTTPFEERLERVLSDEKMPLSRKLSSGRPIELEE